MKAFQKVAALGLSSLSLVACSAKVDAPDLSAWPNPIAEKPASRAILDQPIAGKISDRTWAGKTALATIMSYADGSYQLKIEIVENQFSGCTKPSAYGWDGQVDIFVPVQTGTFGSQATVAIQGRGTDGTHYSQDKSVRIDSIDGDKVALAVFAKADTDEVNGKITARICPSL